MAVQRWGRAFQVVLVMDVTGNERLMVCLSICFSLCIIDVNSKHGPSISGGCGPKQNAGLCFLVLILQCSEGTRINQKCVIYSSGKQGYIFIYLCFACIWNGLPKRNRSVCLFSPDQKVSETVGPACRMRVQTEQETGPPFFFFLIPQESLCPRDTCKHAVYGVCSISNCHFQAGILILCRKMSVLDSRLILYVLVQCDYMLQSPATYFSFTT